MTDILTLEQALLALEDNDDFAVFMDALHAARDTYYNNTLMALPPTGNTRLLQRMLGHLEGLDSLLNAPAEAKRQADRKRNPKPQKYEGRPQIPTLSTEDDD